MSPKSNEKEGDKGGEAQRLMSGGRGNQGKNQKTAAGATARRGKKRPESARTKCG